MENKLKRVKFACGGGNVKLSNNDALNQIVIFWVAKRNNEVLII